MSDAIKELFKEELKKIEISNKICQEDNLDKDELFKEYNNLADYYAKNLKVMMKLTKISDSQQGYLQEIQKELKREVTERKKAEALLQFSIRRIQTVFDNIEALIFVMESNTKSILFMNRHTKMIFDIDDKNFAGVQIDSVFLPEWSDMNKYGKSSLSKEVLCEKRSKWYSITTSHIDWIDGKKVFLQVGIDITERKKIEEQLEYFAYTDQLTGISNRRIGLIMLEKELSRSSRTKEHVSVAFIDVDGLKRVNDEYGHDEGDYLIRSISDIIVATLRESDTICRLGGDEFLLVFPDCKASDAELIIERIYEKMRKHDETEGKPYKLSFSKGLEEIGSGNTRSTAQLLKDLDEKMYKDKMSKKMQRVD